MMLTDNLTRQAMIVLAINTSILTIALALVLVIGP